ncbi:MAG: DUF2782 domain-containing protein [Methylococcaceae bacterium]|jgi:hypothetical protein
MRCFFLLIFLALPALADEAPEPQVAPPQATPEVPDPPLPVQSGEVLEPDITIIRKEKETIQEYRVGGKLYKVKVIPDVGPPYYLIDTNGDGNLDVQRNDADRQGHINLWKLLEW